MSDQYSHLTVEHRQKILEGQILEFEEKKFNHEMNIARLDAVGGDGSAIAVRQSKEAIKVIDQALDVTRKKLEELE